MVHSLLGLSQSVGVGRLVCAEELNLIIILVKILRSTKSMILRVYVIGAFCPLNFSRNYLRKRRVSVSIFEHGIEFWALLEDLNSAEFFLYSFVVLNK